MIRPAKLKLQEGWRRMQIKPASNSIKTFLAAATAAASASSFARKIFPAGGLGAAFHFLHVLPFLKSNFPMDVVVTKTLAILLRHVMKTQRITLMVASMGSACAAPSTSQDNGLKTLSA